MPTLREIYDAYPHSDLLPIEPPGDEGAAQCLDDIDAMADDIGDTLFLFICRELCSDNDEIGYREAHQRVFRAMRDLYALAKMLEAHPGYIILEEDTTPEMDVTDAAVTAFFDGLGRVVRGAKRADNTGGVAEDQRGDQDGGSSDESG